MPVDIHHDKPSFKKTGASAEDEADVLEFRGVPAESFDAVERRSRCITARAVLEKALAGG